MCSYKMKVRMYDEYYRMLVKHLQDVRYCHIFKPFLKYAVNCQLLV